MSRLFGLGVWAQTFSCLGIRLPTFQVWGKPTVDEASISVILKAAKLHQDSLTDMSVLGPRIYALL